MYCMGISWYQNVTTVGNKVEFMSLCMECCCFSLPEDPLCAARTASCFSTFQQEDPRQRISQWGRMGYSMGSVILSCQAEHYLLTAAVAK